LNYFISGLTPEILRGVQALQPMNLSQDTALAKLQEDNLTDSVVLSSSTLPPLLPGPPTSRVNFRKLSTKEMASRRENGLCYKCDETFTPQHKCKGRFFLLISDDGFDTYPPTQTDPTNNDHDINPPTIVIEPPDQDAQISFHAIFGSTDPTTIRIQGHILNHAVTVLIDGGIFLELPSHPTNTLKVMVGNGRILECHRLCSAIPITLQKHTFNVDFYSLPLSGADVVLGAPWLRSISHVLMDYTSLSLSYTMDNKMITLTENKNIGLTQSQPNNSKDVSNPFRF